MEQDNIVHMYNLIKLVIIVYIMLKRLENSLLRGVDKLNHNLSQPLIGLANILKGADPMRGTDRLAIFLNTSSFIYKIKTNNTIFSILPHSDITILQSEIMENRDFKEFLEWTSDHINSRVKGLSVSEAGNYARWFTVNIVKEQFRRIKPNKSHIEDNSLLMVAYNAFSLGADLSANLEMKHFDKKTKERILKLIWGGVQNKDQLLHELDRFEKNPQFESNS